MKAATLKLPQICRVHDPGSSWSQSTIIEPDQADAGSSSALILQWKVIKIHTDRLWRAAVKHPLRCGPSGPPVPEITDQAGVGAGKKADSEALDAEIPAACRAKFVVVGTFTLQRCVQQDLQLI